MRSTISTLINEQRESSVRLFLGFLGFFKFFGFSGFSSKKRKR